MCYVTAFHITGLKIIISEKRWKGPNMRSWEITTNLENRPNERGVKGIVSLPQTALVQWEHIEKWCKNKKSTQSLCSPMCPGKQWAGRSSPLIPRGVLGRMRMAPSLPLASLSLSPAPLHFSLTFLGRYSSYFLYTFEISISSQSDYIQVFLLKVSYSLFCDFIMSSLVCGLLPVFQLLSSWCTCVNPSHPSQAAQTCAWALSWPWAQVTCALQAGGNHLRIHLENTSPSYTSGGDPGSPCLSFWDISGTLHHWQTPDGTDRGNFAENAEFGFLGGLSSWKQSDQEAHGSQPNFIASRATDGFPQAPEICAASLAGTCCRIAFVFLWSNSVFLCL